MVAHDDVIKWKHFSRYRRFVRGTHRPPVNSPHKGQWRGALIFSLIRAWTNGWVNNQYAGDLRRHCAHYNITVMWTRQNRTTTLVVDLLCAWYTLILYRRSLDTFYFLPTSKLCSNMICVAFYTRDKNSLNQIKSKSNQIILLLSISFELVGYTWIHMHLHDNINEHIAILTHSQKSNIIINFDSTWIISLYTKDEPG